MLCDRQSGFQTCCTRWKVKIIELVITVNVDQEVEYVCDGYTSFSETLQKYKIAKKSQISMTDWLTSETGRPEN